MACKVCLLLVLLAFLWEGTTAQSSSGCTRSLMGLSPCLNYVSGNSSTPPSSCCTQLASVVQSKPECLCLLLNGTASSYGFNINQTLALALPDACKVQTPPASRCDAANGPAASPDTPQSPPSDSSSNTPTASSNTPTAASNIPTGSKATPTGTGSANSGSNIKASSNAAVFLVLIASYAVSFVGF